MSETVSNPNDYKVVAFHNSTDFRFTPDMGCMFDGRSINGITGEPGIDAGETLTVPYYIGQQLALNLAKVAITKSAPLIDAAGIPTGVPLWDDQRLLKLKNSYLTELYVEEKSKVLSETDKLMAKVEEYKKMVDDLVVSKKEEVSAEAPAPVEQVSTGPMTFADKSDVLSELTKRGVKFDARKSKAELEKLIV
jgi:hypothetical protein